jgi:hypothetical protein
VKTYDIEVQRLKSIRHDKGVIELGVDALVLPRPARLTRPRRGRAYFRSRCVSTTRETMP